MPRSTIVPWFTPQNYDVIKRAIKIDANLPDTYDKWFNLQTKRIAEIEARGTIVYKVVIDPNEFARYCRASGHQQNGAMLRAYAAAKKAGGNF